jgi:hypothetical protein
MRRDWTVGFTVGSRQGSAEDPRKVLIGITVRAAEFLDIGDPKM